VDGVDGDGQTLLRGVLHVEEGEEVVMVEIWGWDGVGDRSH
jgi:hypothetical protein